MAVALICATATAVVPTRPAHADRIRNDQWHLRYLRVAEAHRISQGAGVTVAVIDTGVDPHPDLRNNLLKGTVTASGESGDGRQDLNGHGTGMAGLVAAHGHNDSGVLGIAPSAKILPIRSEKRSGGSDADNTASGIRWAVANQAKVISISAGGSSSPRLMAAIREALEADTVIIASAGNHPQFYGIPFPAAYDGVLAVGASDRKGNRAEVSVTGKRLGILAPGVDIYSTGLDGGYRKATGTSGAAAIVAGAAALVRSKYPDLSAEEVIHRLTATAVDKGAPGRDEEYGFGVLDLVAALTADVPPLAATPGATTGSPSPTAGETPTAAGGSAAPGTEPAGPGYGSLLIVFGGVVLAGLVVLLFLLRRQRRRVHPTG